MRIKLEWGTHPPMNEIGMHVARQGVDLRFYGLMIEKYALGVLVYSEKKGLEKRIAS